MSPSPDHTPPSPAPSSISFQFDAVVARLRVAGCVFAEDEARLLIAGAADLADLETMIDRRVAGLPLEHILGWAEFCGRRIAVDPGVFVPRKRTEFLVQQAVTLARRADGADLRTAPSAVAAQGGPTGPVIVDMCCGSAAVGVALATALGGAELHAVDIDPTAVRCARRNVDTVGGRVYQGDLYDALPGALRGRVDILLANAPYVPTEEIGMMPPEARLFVMFRPVAPSVIGPVSDRLWLPVGSSLVRCSRSSEATASSQRSSRRLVSISADRIDRSCGSS